jgi:diguanylate cyclase (GGDEF)-like protein
VLPRQDKSQALAKVHRFQRVIARTKFLPKEELNVRLTASFGLATFPHDARDKRDLLAEADRCLFKSKAEGKNRISFAGESSRAQAPENVVALTE